MSNFKKWTRHPETGAWEIADWLDDFYGPHEYAVRFSDGKTFRPKGLETRDWTQEEIEEESKKSNFYAPSLLELEMNEKDIIHTCACGDDPTKEVNEALSKLREEQKENDPEAYHLLFDKILEDRLMELDPEFAKAMMGEYEKSGMSRLYS